MFADKCLLPSALVQGGLCASSQINLFENLGDVEIAVRVALGKLMGCCGGRKAQRRLAGQEFSLKTDSVPGPIDIPAKII